MADAIFQKMSAALNTSVGKEAAKMVNEIITYEFPDTGVSYVIDLKACKAYKGKCEDAAASFKMDEAVFVELAGGKADPMGLFMEGKIELDGDTDVAMKLGKVMKKLGSSI